MKSSVRNKTLRFKSRKMNSYYTFGLILIFVLTFSYGFPSPEDDDDYENDETWKKWSDGEDDYYPDESNESNQTAINNLNSLKNSNSSVNNLTNSTSFIDNIPVFKNFLSFSGMSREPHELEKCPGNCICNNDFQYVDCSNQSLTKIPIDLPSSVILIDLSHNSIEELHPDNFNKFVLIRKILLNDNQISQIDKEIFTDLQHLDSINLASNRLSEINPDAFSENMGLDSIDLSNNPLILPKDRSFLNQPKLEHLNIQNTGINEIYDNNFNNLSGLITLELDHNDFNKKINTKAFEPMQKLVTLRLPDLTEENIIELCKLLTSIDNINFKDYSVSCFQLGSGLPFNESLIYNNEVTDEIIPQITKPKHRIRVKNMNSTTDVQGNGTAIEIVTETKLDTEDSSKIQISQQTINYILIGIMIFAVIGILIGFICRKDYFGIKTKLCRTNKNRRPPPTDQVRPAEEIPLNKV